MTPGAALGSPVRVRRAQPWLGTLVDITVDHEHEKAGMWACDAAFRAVASIDGLMSFHRPESELSRLNRAPAGTLVPVSTDTWNVLAYAERVHRASGGLFDCTVVPVLQSEGFLPASDALLEAAALRSGSERAVRSHRREQAAEAGREHRDRDRATQTDLLLPAPGWVVKRRALRVDLGGIAKGYAVDRAVSVLADAGVKSGWVNAGGDVRVFGPQPRRVEVRDPAQPGRPGAVVSLQNAAIATSAGYFARRRERGCSYIPIANPAAGACIDLECSVSVAADECIAADALTKVIALSLDVDHPALSLFHAQAWILGVEGARPERAPGGDHAR